MSNICHVNDGQVVETGLLNKQDVARRIGVNKRTVDRLMRGGCPHLKLTHKLVRFDWDAVRDWLERKYGRASSNNREGA